MAKAKGLSKPEREAVKQFREYLKDRDENVEHETDRSLLHWLQAQSFNTVKATNMYVHSAQMKIHFRVDKILEEYTPPEVLLKYFAGGFCGFDKEGSPVKIELFANIDWQGLLKSVRKSDFEKYRFWLSEQDRKLMKEQSEKLNKCVDQITCIQDFGKMNMRLLWRPGIEMYMHMIHLYEKNYPENVKKMFFINCPSIFPIMWKIGKKMMSERLRNKITIVTGNYEGKLLEAIDADQLPACYGGTLVDPVNLQPTCPTLVCQGGEVPVTYYLSQTPQLDRLETVEIMARRFLTVECHVRIPKSVIRYEFHTDDNDLGFGILYQPEDMDDPNEDTEILIPINRVNCHQCIEDGSFVCKRKGRYMVIFDNRFSLSKSKMLHYSVDLFSSDPRNDVDVRTHIESGGSHGGIDIDVTRLFHSDHQSSHLRQIYRGDSMGFVPTTMPSSPKSACSNFSCSSSLRSKDLLGDSRTKNAPDNLSGPSNVTVNSINVMLDDSRNARGGGGGTINMGSIDIELIDKPSNTVQKDKPTKKHNSTGSIAQVRHGKSVGSVTGLRDSGSGSSTVQKDTNSGSKTMQQNSLKPTGSGSSTVHKDTHTNSGSKIMQQNSLKPTGSASSSAQKDTHTNSGSKIMHQDNLKPTGSGSSTVQKDKHISSSPVQKDKPIGSGSHNKDKHTISTRNAVQKDMT